MRSKECGGPVADTDTASVEALADRLAVNAREGDYTSPDDERKAAAMLRSLAAERGTLRAALEAAQREAAAKQAQIDELMLEHCPAEMSREQLAEWERHQVAVLHSDLAATLRATTPKDHS